MKTEMDYVYEDIEMILRRFCPKRQVLYRKALENVEINEDFDIRSADGIIQYRYEIHEKYKKPAYTEWKELIPGKPHAWWPKGEDREVTSKFFPSMLHYTDSMYYGNEPEGIEESWIDTETNLPCLRWTFFKGNAITTQSGRLIHTSFNINMKVNICIVGDTLWITDGRHSGKSDCWEYCNTGSRHIHPEGSPWYHELEPERIEKYLNTEIPNCKIWDIVQKRAKELYEASTERSNL